MTDVPQCVAVTGASGFVGRYLCPDLRQRGMRVIALSREVLAGNELTRHLMGVDTVVHLAARAHILNETVQDPVAAFQVANVILTQILWKAAVQASVRRFIFVSTAGVLGAVSPIDGFDDSSAPAPHDAYTASKLEAEKFLIQQSSGVTEVAIVRPPLIYGPGAPGNLMRLMRVAMRGWPLPIGDLHAQRSLLSVRNLSDLIAALIGTRQDARRTMLVADQETISVSQLYRRVAHWAGHRVWLAPVPGNLLSAVLAVTGRRDDISRLTGCYRLRPTVAGELLSWRPPRPLDEELRWMVETELSGRRPP